MIVGVIADDLTGAAELAAAAAAMGYTAEVHTTFDPASDAEVICVDTDTRAMPPDHAARNVADISRSLLRAQPRWIFKKTDSVLRGNVRAEIESMLNVAGLVAALLVPANPSRGRVIRDGAYYVDNMPLELSAFGSDPDHPRRSSKVHKLLGESESILDRVEIPDTENESDIRHHAARLNETTLAAGGVDFFQAVLKVRAGTRQRVTSNGTFQLPALFCCGSLQAWRGDCADQCTKNGIPVVLMPEAPISNLIDTASIIEDWVVRIVDALSAKRIAMAAIGDGRLSDQRPSALAGILADTVRHVLSREPISTLCMEGGATAAAVLSAMGWTRLKVCPSQQLPGVGVMTESQSQRPIILVKPGSYAWPHALWRNLSGTP